MKITVKKLADLRKPAHNIRRHSDKQITEYIRSIEMFGQIKPLVVDEHGEIIAGNGLFEALTRMGRETCDCYVVTGLTDVQKKKLMMADNKVYTRKKLHQNGGANVLFFGFIRNVFKNITGLAVECITNLI